MDNYSYILDQPLYEAGLLNSNTSNTSNTDPQVSPMDNRNDVTHSSR